MPMKLYIGADLVPTALSQAAFSCSDLTEIIEPKLLSMLKSADYRIFNLECPLVDGGTPMEKFGPSISAPTAAVCGLQALGADLLTLANNHILDYGEAGLASTRRVLESAGIAAVGAGKGSDRCGIYQLEKDGITVGIYACAEHEFSVTPAHMAGAVGYDPAVSLPAVSKLKESCDAVIVLYHGGREMWQYPTPQLRERCHALADAGADLVICQHSHCIGCGEHRNNATIVYGQGNFHFALEDECTDLWCTSLLLEVEVSADRLQLNPIPLRLKGKLLTPAEDQDAKAICADYADRSAELVSGVADERFQAVLDEITEHYLIGLSGNRFYRFFSRLWNKLTGGRYKKRKLEKMYAREDLLRLINYLECETHREMLLGALHRTLSKTKR